MSPEDPWVSARRHERRITTLEREIADVRQAIGVIERHLGLDVVDNHVVTDEEDLDG